MFGQLFSQRGTHSALGVCGGHGNCLGDGSTASSSEGGTCDCNIGWDIRSNCTHCSTNFFPEGPTCKLCTCEATIHNATNAQHCQSSNICSGHGNCSHVPDQTCDCNEGWTGDDCSDSTNGNGGKPLGKTRTLFGSLWCCTGVVVLVLLLYLCCCCTCVVVVLVCG